MNNNKIGIHKMNKKTLLSFSNRLFGKIQSQVSLKKSEPITITDAESWLLSTL